VTDIEIVNGAVRSVTANLEADDALMQAVLN
jgi:hypothetical protein